MTGVAEDSSSSLATDLVTEGVVKSSWIRSPPNPPSPLTPLRKLCFTHIILYNLESLMEQRFRALHLAGGLTFPAIYAFYSIPPSPCSPLPAPCFLSNVKKYVRNGKLRKGGKRRGGNWRVLSILNSELRTPNSELRTHVDGGTGVVDSGCGSGCSGWSVGGGTGLW